MVDPHDDVRIPIEEVPLVLNRNEGPLGPVVRSDLRRLDQQAERLQVPLDSHVPEDQQRRRKGACVASPTTTRRRINPDVDTGSVGKEVDDLDVEIGRVERPPDTQLLWACM